MNNIRRTPILACGLLGAAFTYAITIGVAANAAPVARTALISNAEPRRDTDGKILDAHDGCLEYLAGKFYLFGTRYGSTNGLGKTNRYVCYSSPDLSTWTFHGEVLKDAPPRTYYRPYVKFNRASGKYVMWYNADNQYGVAVADDPEGPYAIHNPNAKVKHSDGRVGDLGLFVDDDGVGYITYTAGWSHGFGIKVEPIPHHQICVEKLSPDYLSSTLQASDFVAGNCESPALFRRGKTYYLLFDNTCAFCKSGSGARVYTADVPLGPYAYRGNINVKTANARSAAPTFTSPGSGRPDALIQAQQTQVAVLPGPDGPQYLWLGDRWGSCPDGIKGHDFQYWSSPLQFDAAGMILPLTFEDSWKMQLPEVGTTDPKANTHTQN